MSYCDHQKFNLTGVFFLIFLFVVTGRRILFICSAVRTKKRNQAIIVSTLSTQ